MSKRVLTKEKFKKWLKNKHPRTKIGQPAQCDACPIAKFLIQETGIPHEVEETEYKCGTSSDFKSLPEWAVKFIEKVDDLDTRFGTRFVTAKKALELLEAR